MARKSGFVRRHGRMVRETNWFSGTLVNSTVAAASTAVLLTSLNAAALALRPFTVIRTRGILQIRSDQTAAAESQQAAYGECVVSDQAQAIGVTAVPTPVTDSGSDLFYVYEWLLNSLEVTTDIGRYIDQPPYRYDSKAMRKVEVGQDMITVWETGAASDGASLTVFSRALIKLH